MRLLRLIIAVLVTVTIASAALRAASDDKKPANKSASTKKSSDKKKKEKPSTFAGEVVRSGGSSIWVKHANGTIKEFTASGTTKISGAPGAGAITKGSMVTVQSTKKSVLSIQVTKLAPPPGHDREEGGPVTGTLTAVTTDSYGDTGTIVVKTSKGKTHQFNCTNITKVRVPNVVHTMQYLRKGQSVTVEHDGHNVALFISVH